MSGWTPAGRGSRWDAVLFDLDGTLADTVALIVRCYRHTMETHLGYAPPDEAWLTTMGRPLSEAVREFARSDGEAAAMLETYTSYQATIHDRMVRPYPGVPEVVSTLSGAGVPLAIVTSKRREVAFRTLGRCGLDGHFQVLVGGDEVARAKPHPEPVLSALELLGVRPTGRVLFVGDSPYDVLSGRGAGVVTAAALWGPHPRASLEAAGAHHFARVPGDLLAIGVANARMPDGP